MDLPTTFNQVNIRKVEAPSVNGTERGPKRKFSQQQAGQLVTEALEKARDECKAKVKQIVEECKEKNLKYRDIEFDLENDEDFCLYGLNDAEKYTPSDVQRVTQIFENPRLFGEDGSIAANNIYQGALGDCWLMSALATLSSCPHIVKGLFVESDVDVGVYGFVFFKNSEWVNVIIDDLLFTETPKFEVLSEREQQFFHNDKDAYNKSARQGGKQLYFAKSGDKGETWVPLLEKAYAKLYGSYASIHGGWDCEAMEDMTGGVAGFIPTKDILNKDKFWEEELLKANEDRLFGCSFDRLERNFAKSEPGGGISVQGLQGSHSYSVLRAKECNGKKFVVVRNPWGKGEWNGRWSDGSIEWSDEWLNILKELGHCFGHDGQFVMEYEDFLNTWQDISRIIIFDESWTMSANWLHVPMKPLPYVWKFGDVSFTISLRGPETPSKTVIVLSQLDKRYFKTISGRTTWSLDFLLFKDGKRKAASTHAQLYTRSVRLEIDLDPGVYVVYVRIDRELRSKGSGTIEDYQLRQLSRVLAQRSISQSIASNAPLLSSIEEFIPTSISDLTGKTSTGSTYTSVPSATVVSNGGLPENPEAVNSLGGTHEDANVVNVRKSGSSGDNLVANHNKLVERVLNVSKKDAVESPYDHYLTQDDNNLYLGLKVYTKKEVSVKIEGKLNPELVADD